MFSFSFELLMNLIHNITLHSQQNIKKAKKNYFYFMTSISSNKFRTFISNRTHTVSLYDIKYFYGLPVDKYTPNTLQKNFYLPTEKRSKKTACLIIGWYERLFLIFLVWRNFDKFFELIIRNNDKVRGYIWVHGMLTIKTKV